MVVQFQSGTLATPSSTVDVASDTIGGLDYERIKVVWGTTGTATELTTVAGLPVQVTAQSSALNVNAAQSGSWTVTTTPSSIISVNQGTSPWATSINSSTTIIGSVAPSSQWTVTTTPSSIISVNQSGTWSVGVSSGTVTLTSGTLALGTVAVSSGTVTLTSGTLALGTVAVSSGSITATLSSGTQTIGTIIQSSGTQTLGTVLQGSPPWSVAQTSSTGFLGSVAVTSGTVTLTSGALALGTVTLSSGTQTLGTVIQSSGTAVLGKFIAGGDVATAYTSGVATTVLYANASSSSTLVNIVTGTAGKIISVLAAWVDVSTTSTIDFNIVFTSSASTATYSGKFFMRGNLLGPFAILPYCPVGWFQGVSGSGLALTLSAVAAGSSGVTVNVTYVSI